MTDSIVLTKTQVEVFGIKITKTSNGIKIQNGTSIVNFDNNQNLLNYYNNINSVPEVDIVNSTTPSTPRHYNSKNCSSALAKKKKEFFQKYNVKGAKIVECYIDNEEIFLNRFNHIFEKFCERVDNKETIMKYSKLNIKTEKPENNKKGRYWMEKLQLSVQSATVEKFIDDIANIAEICYINFYIKLCLSDPEIVEPVEFIV